MKNLVITEIMQEMVGYLNNEQLEKLEKTLNHLLWSKEIINKEIRRELFILMQELKFIS